MLTMQLDRQDLEFLDCTLCAVLGTYVLTVSFLLPHPISSPETSVDYVLCVQPGLDTGLR